MTPNKKTILVVDDDYDYLFQMKINLETPGFDVLTAESQKAAEQVVEKNKIDLALLDLMMENQDTGFILCYKFKRKYPELPIIIGSAVTAETGLQFGVNNPDDKNWIKADLFLDKGTNIDIIVNEINKLIKK